MKSLRPLLLLPLAAVAAQAYTLELELGKTHPTGMKDSNVVGLTVASQVNESFSLGLNLNSRGLSGGTQNFDLDARTALAELTYDLNARGGIRPFIGAGLGYSWLSNNGTTETSKSKSVLATDVFAGVRFALSENLDLAFTVKNTEFIGVKNAAGSSKSTLTDWSQSVSLRLKF
jgi:opacity protein-like surface antigen